MNELDDLSVATTIVYKSLRIRDYLLYHEIADVIRDTCKDTNQTMGQVVNLMQIQWEHHKAARDRLEWCFDYPHRFLLWPLWTNEKAWPWKPGQAPRAASTETRKPQQWAINRWQMLKDNESPMMQDCPAEIREMLK